MWNIVGPQGDSGPAGPQGPAGADGADGAQGLAGPQGPVDPLDRMGLTEPPVSPDHRALPVTTALLELPALLVPMEPMGLTGPTEPPANRANRDPRDLTGVTFQIRRQGSPFGQPFQVFPSTSILNAVRWYS